VGTATATSRVGTATSTCGLGTGAATSRVGTGTAATSGVGTATATSRVGTGTASAAVRRSPCDLGHGFGDLVFRRLVPPSPAHPELMLTASLGRPDTVFGIAVVPAIEVNLHLDTSPTPSIQELPRKRCAAPPPTLMTVREVEPC